MNVLLERVSGASRREKDIKDSTSPESEWIPLHTHRFINKEQMSCSTRNTNSSTRVTCCELWSSHNSFSSDENAS